MKEVFLIVLGSGSVKFYAQKELDELYRIMKQTPYEKKTEWQKFLNDDASIQSRKRTEIREYEVPLKELDN